MYRILFVCTGNICRSPTAEGIARALLAARDLPEPVEVDSAGTYAGHAGEPPDVRARLVAEAHGYDLSALRARPVQSADFERFDLILGMDRGHVQDLRLQAGHRHRDRVKLFLDFAPEVGERDVPDPYGRAPEDYARAFALIEQGCRALVDGLGRALAGEAPLSRPGPGRP